MNFAVDRFTEFQVRNEDNEIVATFYAGANDEGKFTLQGDNFSLSRADTMQFLQWMNERAKASDKEKSIGENMNGVEKLKQLTNVYRMVLNEGITSDRWVLHLREKMKDYGQNLIITASDIDGYPSFLEWVADKVPGATDIGGIGFFTHTDLVLALHQYQKNDPNIADNRSNLEILAREKAVEKIAPEEIRKVEVAYQQLFDVVQRVNNLDRYAQFRALDDLIRAIEVWLDGCKMIDIEIW